MSAWRQTIHDATEAERAGDPDRAARLLAAAADLDPGSAEPLRLLAELERRRGRVDEAIRLALRASRLDPASATIPFRIAEWLTYLGRYDEAVPFFRRAQAADPKWLEVGEILGRNLWFCHRFDEAREEWRRWRARQRDAAHRAGYDPDAFRILSPAWTGWLGNNAHLDPYLKLRKLGLVPDVPLKLMAPPGRIANAHFLSYLEPFCEIVRDEAECARLSALHAMLGDPLHTWFIDRDTPSYYLSAMAIAQTAWENAGRAPLLRLSDEDRAFGREALAGMGVGSDDWFVCLHVREGGFWNERDLTWNAPRTAPVLDYLPAMRRIVAAGGRVIRLGDPSMTPLPETPGVIDYARSRFKSDRLDIVLAASCRFLVGTNSAIYWVSAAFGVPALLTNWMPVTSHPLQAADRMVPKLIRDRRTGQPISFEAMFALPRETWSGHYFAEHDFDPVDNDPGELEEAVLEMMRDVGMLPPRVPTPALLHRYDDLRRRARIPGSGRLSEVFLERHAHLLGPGEASSH